MAWESHINHSNTSSLENQVFGSAKAWETRPGARGARREQFAAGDPAQNPLPPPANAPGGPRAGRLRGAPTRPEGRQARGRRALGTRKAAARRSWLRGSVRPEVARGSARRPPQQHSQQSSQRRRSARRSMPAPRPRPLSCGPRGSSPCWAGGAGRGAPGSTLRPSQCRLGTWVSVGWRLLGFPFFTILLWEHQAHDHVLTGLTSCLLENLLTLIFSNVKMQTCAIVTCRIAFISLPFVSK